MQLTRVMPGTTAAVEHGLHDPLTVSLETSALQATIALQALSSLSLVQRVGFHRAQATLAALFVLVDPIVLVQPSHLQIALEDRIAQREPDLNHKCAWLAPTAQAQG